MADEFARIELLRRAFDAPNRHVAVGIGDDAAVLQRPDHAQVASVDVAVENVHFRRAWAGLDAIGERAIATAVSDLAAMGADPTCILSSIIMSPEEPEESLVALATGMARAAARCGTTICGGNLSSGSELSISTTVLGTVPGPPLLRSGAQPGDGLYVTGFVGSAALGLALLERGEDPSSPDSAPFIRRFLAPMPRLVTAARLRSVASAVLDVSDGLLQDLRHLCTASGVGARLSAGQLPFEAGYADRARQLGRDPAVLALTGGEDYELLFAAPLSRVASEVATRIGTVTANPGEIEVLGVDRELLANTPGGHSHFR